MLNQTTEQTVTSMKSNSVDSFKLVDNKPPFKLTEMPGLGFYRSQMMELLPSIQVLILMVDSSDKKSFPEAASYLYDVINAEHFNETLKVIIACNKNDLPLARSVQIVESELAQEM